MEKILINTRLLASFMVAASISLTSASVVASEPAEAQAYVDSVTQWGAWELDIEPAAGGIAQADTDALKARESKVTPRTNSFTAVSPLANLAGGSGGPSNPGGGPTVPTVPGITPIDPSVPIPTGNPGSSGPTVTPISPNVPIPTGNP